jgi:molybdopterin-containing oxidoreductase family membrane subunit
MNFTSPIVWDTLILVCYVIIGIIFTRQMILVHQGKAAEESLKRISVIAFAAGLLVTVTAFVFAMQTSSPAWNNAGQPLSFLLAAVAVTLCLLIMVYSALRSKGYIEIEEGTLPNMGKIAALFLGGELIYVLSEVAIGFYAQAGNAYEVTRWLVFGSGAVFFWLQMVGLVLGIILLSKYGKTLLVAGSVIGFCAVVMIKYNMLQAQFANALIAYPGPPSYGVMGQAYLPSLLEVGVSVGIVSLGALLVLLGLPRLNLGSSLPEEKSETTGQTPEA